MVIPLCCTRAPTLTGVESGAPVAWAHVTGHVGADGAAALLLRAFVEADPSTSVIDAVTAPGVP